MFFVPVRRDILNRPKVEPWLETLHLTHLDPRSDVGKLHVEDRFRLRVMLALIARPDADLLIVDDIDQIRSLKLRNKVLDDLTELSHRVPVLVTTVNDDEENHADRIIDMRYGRDQGVLADPDGTAATATADAAENESPWSGRTDTDPNSDTHPDTEETEEATR